MRRGSRLVLAIAAASVSFLATADGFAQRLTTHRGVRLDLKQGGQIVLPPFRMEVSTPDHGAYFIGRVMDPMVDAPFLITADGSPNAFWRISLVLYGGDSLLRQRRLQAEAALRRWIPLTNAQYCAANIEVASAPSHGRGRYDGRNLGLSFCPGALRL